MIRRVAYLTIHTSPLAQPGIGEAGGMNVYVDQLARTMAARGVAVDVFTRAAGSGWPEVVEPAPGYRVVHVPVGPHHPLEVSGLAAWVGPFAERVVDWAQRPQGEGTTYDVVHSHYWLSGWAGLLVKKALGVPLAHSFHTLGRMKEANRRPGEPPESLLRIAAEHEVIEHSDCLVASTPVESDDLIDHYMADPAKLCVSPPGVDHGVFRPGPREEARRFLGLGDEPLLLFVGRIQPLKGLDVAVETLRLVTAQVPEARLVVVGGPSGPSGERELARIERRVAETGLSGRVRRVWPQPHPSLALFYQAADVLLVPSRSESFGLVAVEAQACGLPVVAARVGGLVHALEDEVSGFLVDGWEAEEFAKPVLDILTSPAMAALLSQAAVDFSQQFSWEATGDRMLELYEGISGP